MQSDTYELSSLLFSHRNKYSSSHQDAEKYPNYPVGVWAMVNKDYLEWGLLTELLQIIFLSGDWVTSAITLLHAANGRHRCPVVSSLSLFQRAGQVPKRQHHEVDPRHCCRFPDSGNSQSPEVIDVRKISELSNPACACPGTTVSTRTLWLGSELSTHFDHWFLPIIRLFF